MKSKYVIIATAAIVIITITLLSYLHSANKKEIMQLFQSEQLNDSRQLAKEIEAFLMDKMQDIYTFTSLPSFYNNDKKRITEEIQNYFNSEMNNHIKETSVYDGRGNIICSTNRKAIGRNYKQSDYFQWAAKKENKGKQFVSSLPPNTEDAPKLFSNSRILLVVPIYHKLTSVGQSEPIETFEGIVASTIDLSGLISELLLAVVPDTSSTNTFIIDSAGMLMLHTKHPEMVLMNARMPDKTCFHCHASFDHINRILSGKEGSIEYALKESSNELASYSSIEMLNVSWRVVITISYQKVLGFINSDLEMTLILFGVIFFSLAGGFVFILRGNRLKVRAEEETKQWKEKHNLEVKLRESESQYKTIVDSSQNPIFIHSEGKIVFANPAALSTYGAENQDELIGKSIFDLVHPENSDLVKQRVKEMLESGRPVPIMEERFYKRDGSVILAEVAASPITYHNKPAVQVIVTDITEKRRFESQRQVIHEITQGVTVTSNLDELLKLIHNSLEKLVYAENIFVALHDKNTGLFSFPYFVDKYDPTPEPAAMRKSCTAYVFRTGESLLLTPERFKQLKEQNEVELVGSAAPSWIGVPLKIPSRTIGVLVLQHYENKNAYSESDLQFLNTVGNQIAFVIERKLAEEALRKEKEFSQAAIDSLPGLFYLFDDQGHFLRWNKIFENITGYSSEETSNLSPLSLFDEADKKIITGSIQQVFIAGKANFEADLLTKDKTKISFFFSAKRLQFGNTQCLVGVGLDISDRKKAEADLQNEQLLLRTVIDNIPVSIYTKDIACRKTLANRTELLYSGVDSEAEIIGKTDFDYYPKELAEGFFADDQLVIQTGQPVLNREEYIIDKLGQKEWLLTSKLPLKDKKGTVIGIVGIGHNITSRKLAEESIRESETKLKVILESTADGILAVDDKGNVIKSNKRFAELWRIPQALIDARDDNALLNYVLSQLTNPDEFVSKVQILHNTTEEDLDILHFKDGRIFERFSTPLRMQDSSVGRVWSFRDITVQKRAEELLKSSELKFKTVADFTYDWEYWEGENNQILYISPSCERMTGYMQNEFISDPMLLKVIVHPDDADLITKHHKAVFQYDQRNEINELEFRIIKKDNSIVTVYHTCRPIFNDDKKYLGRRVSNRDITERKRAEQEIRESEERYRMLFEKNPVPMWVYDLETFRFLAVNNAAIDKYGYSQEEFLSITIKDIRPLEDIPSLMQNVAEVKSDLQKSTRWRHRLKNGTIISVEIYSYNLEFFGKKARLVFANDVTDKIIAEEKIQKHNEELLKLNSEKDKFFSIIAHDLKSPFMGFIGLTEIIVQDINTFSQAELLKLLHEMHRNAKNLFKLLANLLEWARMQQGTISFNPEELLLSAEVSNNIDLLVKRGEQKGIEIISQVLYNQTVYADKPMLNTVLRNLLSNAVKYTMQSGKIIVAAKGGPNDMVEISVTDSGIGMSAELCSKLFKIEEKVGRKGTDEEESTGLGLLLCKDFVEINGGRIWVESVEGKGSSFYFTLPEKIKKPL
jgi:PAS domain S-box-containing protein